MAYDPLRAPHPGQGLAHPQSYWAATAGEAPDDDGPLAGDRDAEVAIIGGGYTGLSCAYFLARDFGIHAVVLEANRPAWGCSGRNGGFTRGAIGKLSYQQWIDKWGVETARALFADTQIALATARDVIREGAIECDVQPDGGLKLAHRPSRVKALEAERKLLSDVFDCKTELLDPAAIEAAHFKGAEAHAGLRDTHSFGLHPLKLAYGVLRMARGDRAVVHRASPVTEWTREGRTHILHTPGGRVRAPLVVLATNGYTPEGLHSGIRGRLLPLLSNIIVTRPMTAAEKDACRFVTSDVMSDTKNMSPYFLRLPDDRILFGGRGPIRESDEGMALHRDRLLVELKAKFPLLADITADYFWGGWVCFPLDFIPHIHHTEDDSSVHYAIGYAGRGVAYGLHAGRLLAARLAGRDTGTIAAPVDTTLRRYPLAAFRRLGQRVMTQWYRFQDNRD
jgi:gamma-glutamylputrescine oxidase